MDLIKQGRGMKGPARPAPAVPGVGFNRFSPVTNWNDDPFGADVFEPTPQFAQKKKPPPRPPPPQVNPKQPDVPIKPSHFIRKPTVLTSLLSRSKNKIPAHSQNASQNLITDSHGDVDLHNFFPKCEPKSVHTGALIDLSSPPSSPTFTTRSSSDGLSVDSFGSDATTSTSHHNALNGGNASQAESGFEDDFELFLNIRKPISKEDTFEDFASVDPFSPHPVPKPLVAKKPAMNRDLSNNVITQPLLKGPTIIRAKPARPKPPETSALLRSTFGSSFPVNSMNVNTTTPIQKIFSGFGNNFETKPLSWDEESSPERESSPPMPSVPPPPPPALVEDELSVEWPEDESGEGSDSPGSHGGPAGVDATSVVTSRENSEEPEEPYAIALFDYFTDHPEDLCFSVNTRIKLIRRVDQEWVFGRLASGAEGVFPANYVAVKRGLPGEPPAPAPAPAPARLAVATALYDFAPAQPGDLSFFTGDTIAVMYKISEEWYFGECNGAKGQFPVNYVHLS